MKNKHLTIEEREQIYEGLRRNVTFKEIGKWIGKDPSTVSKEIKKHLTIHPTTVKRFDSEGNPLKLSPCPLLLKPPYCCNGCRKKHGYCSFDKYFYEYRTAQKEYQTTLVESREGIALNRQDFWDTDRIVSDELKKGKHLYQIVSTNDLAYSQSSIYRLLKEQKLSFSAIDLPRQVKFRPRRKQRPEYIPSSLKVGRTFDDFNTYISEHDIQYWVEMDTVVGKVGGKCIMTFDFTFCNFMFGVLIDDKTADCVACAIRNIKAKFYKHNLCFGDIFPVILTDNGGEFANIAAFEADMDGVPETKLFFCDPGKAYQKPRVEKNHTLFRDIVPKGTSFNDFSQQTVDLIFSHINSTSRKIFNGKTPYELFCFTYEKDVADILGITKIDADKVIQTPLLLKR